MKCPQCGLLNPDSAQRCDCGYDFASRSMRQSYLTEKQQRQRTQLRRVSSRHRIVAFISAAAATALLLWLIVAAMSDVRGQSGVLAGGISGLFSLIGFAGAGTAVVGGLLALMPRTAAIGQPAMWVGIGSGLTTLAFFQFVLQHPLGGMPGG